ncbi:hypothetical protein BG015_008384 [Linnemannia schmuckeri]|uniref:Uncharacterized protein n=1 Tax=Linnemannia schmuckeri TaxID=64567 RepID=A0A9P5RZK5_9FUNG|nr:hypothetical protein BG015_008384 [Linnemannia schmuckeri]
MSTEALDVTPQLLQRVLLQPAISTLTYLELCWKLTSEHSPSVCCTEDLADVQNISTNSFATLTNLST